MVKVTSLQFYMNRTLLNNLNIISEAVRKKNLDLFLVIDGDEGSGKTTLAGQIARLLDPKFGLDDVLFSIDALFEKIDYYANHNEKFRAIILDESRKIASSEAAMSKDSRKIKNKIAEVRKLNLFFIWVLPSFFSLDKDIAVRRSRALIHVYMGKNFKRGKFLFYSRPRKHRLYEWGKKHYESYKYPPANFKGDFTSFAVLDAEAYDEKARAAIREGDEAEEFGASRAAADRIRRDFAVSVIERHPCFLGMSKTDLAKVFGVQRGTVREWLKSVEGGK